MRSNPTYVVLAMRGDAWEAVGPLVATHPTLKAAENAAYELSARFPQRTFGVYQLQTVFGTEQKIVKQKIKPAELPQHEPEQHPQQAVGNVYKIQATG